MAALRIPETVKDAITEFTGMSPATFVTSIAVGLSLYYLALKWFGSYSGEVDHGGFDETTGPLPPPVQVGEITDEELKQFDGSDAKKPLLMAIKGQIYDVTQSRNFYGPGGPYALFAGKDASRALAKMSFEEKDLNGDVSGLGVFEVEALQDWEHKFMTKYVKVGTVKGAGRASEDGVAEASEGCPVSSPQETADGDVVKAEEDGSAVKEPAEETKE